MIIGCDVDGVICPSCAMYLDWLQEITGKSLPDMVMYDYNPTPYFKKELDGLGMDGWEFFRDRKLYDSMPVCGDAVKYLTKLKNLGHDIVWVSAVKGDHLKSKVEFLKRNFPFWDGMITTKEKHFARVDVMIDDRLDNLIRQPDNVMRILYKTKFSNVGLTCSDYHLHTNDWYSIYDAIIPVSQRYLEICQERGLI